MVVVSYLRLILSLLLVICCVIGQAESNANRRRRQATGDINRNVGNLPRNLDESGSSKNIQFNPSNNPNFANSYDRNNQDQSNKNLLPSSQGQVIRSRGFYDSPAFKPPSFSGDKPTGWFDTKHPNWVSNQDDQLDKNNMIDGKNAPPSSLQGKPIQPRREDGGAYFLQKVANQYASKGDKVYNFAEYNAQKRRGSICTNVQNFNGYTFGRFPCPLPPGTGMNQLDQFCCGPVNYQYCCNAQEVNQEQSGGLGNYNDKQRHSKHAHYPPKSNRALAIVLPIIAILVIAGAVIIVLLYYKKLRNEQSKDGKSASVARLNDNYSAVPQDAPVEKPVIVQRREQKTTVQT